MDLARRLVDPVLVEGLSSPTAVWMDPLAAESAGPLFRLRQRAMNGYPASKARPGPVGEVKYLTLLEL
jgi:hypothetical protein